MTSPVLPAAIALLSIVPFANAQDGDKAIAEHAAKPPIAWEGAAPKIDLRVEPLGQAGWRVTTNVSGFTFAPQNAGRKHVPGEGHMHLYVDGKKITRLYGQPYFLSGLSKGAREISVTLNNNEHRDYHLSGKPILATATVEQGETVQFERLGRSELKADPGLSVLMKRDPVHGWNAVVSAEAFDFKKGYAELHINGSPAGRIHGGYHYLKDFQPERDSITVSLCDAAGRSCSFAGKPVHVDLGRAHQMCWFATQVRPHNFVDGGRARDARGGGGHLGGWRQSRVG